MNLTFVQLSAFTTNWARMRLTDEDLRRLEATIAEAPDAAPVMRGSGGLRKIRFASSASGRGKSGGARACYAYFPEHELVYLCAVFPKNEKANLTAAESAAYRKVLDSFRRYLHENWKKGWTP